LWIRTLAKLKIYVIKINNLYDMLRRIYMDKPTIFFSHSSKDKDSLLVLKKLIEEKIGGTLEIFMSSDGQSIPFGSNWIHKIEHGLENARIMFVFVTSNSLLSNWIYFEAGFAYSKGIEVIPVGIGVDIGKIPPPINLLQGFNITSSESLNNIINIINKKFSYSFKENFTEEEYDSFNLYSEKSKLQFFLNNRIETINSSIFSYTDTNNEKISLDMPKVFDKKNKKILINGLQLVYKKNSENDEIRINMSPYDFDKSYKILNDIIAKSYNHEKDIHYIHIELNKLYDVLNSDVKISSLISKDTLFSLNEEMIGKYLYKDIIFFIFDKNKSNYGKSNLPMENRIGIIFKVGVTKIEVIYELLERLYNIEIIYEKG
jgi:hypothetical protein